MSFIHHFDSLENGLAQRKDWTRQHTVVEVTRTRYIKDTKSVEIAYSICPFKQLVR